MEHLHTELQFMGILKPLFMTDYRKQILTGTMSQESKRQ